MPVTLYGFAGCTTVRNARKWLDAHGVAYEFFDYRIRQLEPVTVDGWFGRAGWEAVFNRGSATFRNLPEATRLGIDEDKARTMILDETNLIRRPVLDAGGRLHFGFKPEEYAALFAVNGSG